MRCPFCLETSTKVLDSRETRNFEVRRRRECTDCTERFTTYETTEASILTVTKRDSTEEAFNIDKIRTGIEKSCKKRDVSQEAIDAAVEEIESQVRFEAEAGTISSKRIGELVIQQLKELDEVAYMRFISIYKNFHSITDFKEELDEIAPTLTHSS